MTRLTKLITTLTVAAVAALTFSTTAAADAPSFDSDCVGTQWVIRNRGLEPFNVGTPAGDIYMAVNAVWAPPANLGSVVISDTVIIRGSCGVLAPARSSLPATGNSSLLAMLACALIAAGAATLRLARIRG